MTVQHSAQLSHLIPILNVSDFLASMAYYTERLGFKKAWEWGDPPGFGCVVRDGVEIFLCHGGQGQPGTWASVFVVDVDALHDEFQRRGAKIVRAPVDEPWGMREFHVQDPDGHTFRFGRTAADSARS